MSRKTSLYLGAGLFIALVAVVPPLQAADAGTASSATENFAASPAPAPPSVNPAGRFGAAFRLSSLGFGGEVAVRVQRRINLRGGFNFFSYSGSGAGNGINFNGSLKWESAEAHIDFYPFGPLHLSPGAIFYNNNHIDLTASVPGGKTFTLNNVEYMSAAAPNNVSGTGSLSFTKAAPTFMIGLGNLVPRSRRHFTFNIEGGIAFTGSPKIGLSLTGQACPASGSTCTSGYQNVATNATIQQNVTGEQNKLSNDLTAFKFYPLLGLSFGIHF